MAGANEAVGVRRAPDGLIGDGSLGEVVQTLAGLCIPEFDVAVEGGGQELGAVPTEGGMTNGTSVTNISRDEREGKGRTFVCTLSCCRRPTP